MRIRHCAGAIGLIIALAGCGALPPLVTVLETPRTDAVLSHYRRLTGMSADEQRLEYDSAQRAYEESQTEGNRMRLVMALLVPDAPWRDDALVLKLLAADRSSRHDDQIASGDLAWLLDRMVTERLRLLREESRKLDAMQQRFTALREENRKMEQLRQKFDSANEAANEERRKTEALQKKLDELREIDRGFRKRPAPRSAP